MTQTAKKPTAYNNSWLGNTVTTAQLQVINENTNKWDTIGECVDTPNAIANELSKKKYKGQSIWIKTFTGRSYHGLVK
jgi:hypothetical protein